MTDTAAFDPKRFTSIEEQEGWFNTLARTVAVDFDGVLHPYTAGWVGSVPADEPPTPGAREFLRRLIESGYRIVVFSTTISLTGTRARRFEPRKGLTMTTAGATDAHAVAG